MHHNCGLFTQLQVLQAERDWVRRAARQLLLSKALKAWLGYVRGTRRNLALTVAADCHRSDALRQRAWSGWKQARQTSSAAVHMPSKLASPATPSECFT